MGSAYDIDGQTIISNSAALREVAQRDLEDFAQFGLRWSNTIENYITGYRITLLSEDDHGMKIRIMPSARKAGMQGDVLSATSHVDDSATIDNILAHNYWPGDGGGISVERLPGALLGVGQSATYNDVLFDIALGVTDGAPGNRLIQMMFEGVTAGDGEIVFELLHEETPVTSSSINLRLRPMKELYDHYNVSYGANVTIPDRTFRNDVDPLDQLTPVPTTAELLDENLERSRIQNQSKDYFVFVHGWRIKQWERIAFAQSSYKRLYWSGFKGQFGLFDWPTQWVEDPASDPGNFDRSEFIAWNSAAGLVNALNDIRGTKMPSGGTLSVMAHSLGNVVLSEALYQHHLASPGTHLVDNAILSQAAISSHYFGTDPEVIPIFYNNPNSWWVTNRVELHFNPNWTEYRGVRIAEGNRRPHPAIQPNRSSHRIASQLLQPRRLWVGHLEDEPGHKAHHTSWYGLGH